MLDQTPNEPLCSQCALRHPTGDPCGGRWATEIPTPEAGLLSPEELSAILTEPRLTSTEGVKVSFSMVPEVGLLAGHIHAQERAIASLTTQKFLTCVSCGDPTTEVDSHIFCLACGDAMAFGDNTVRAQLAEKDRILVVLTKALELNAKGGCIRMHWGAMKPCNEYDDGRELCAHCQARKVLADLLQFAIEEVGNAND